MEINETVIVASRWFLYYFTYIDDARSNTNQVIPDLDIKMRESIILFFILFLFLCNLLPHFNTFAASYLNTQGLNNSCLKSPASTLVDLTFQSRARAPLFQLKSAT